MFAHTLARESNMDECLLGNPNERGGWVVGHFKSPGLAQTSHVEIKMWRYEGPINYGEKKFAGTEWFSVEGGALRVIVKVGDEVRTYDLYSKERGNILLPPGTVKTVEVLQFPAWGVTVRWPSAPENNQIVRST
jgi:hypothetical protein